ncbi:MAG: hypothetical protein C0503_05155 [Gemmatimonas sp.]|nr:hypothetical protein [Gemmatimonas sp.]
MPIQEPWNTIREFAGLVLLLGVVVWGLVNVRHRLRPWYLIFWGASAIVSLPITVYLVTEARAGNFSGWGGLGMVIILLPAAFVAALSVTALLTLAVLIPRYGFNEQSPEAREAERQRRRDPAVVRAKAIRDLKIYAVMIAIALLILKLRALGR